MGETYGGAKDSEIFNFTSNIDKAQKRRSFQLSVLELDISVVNYFQQPQSLQVYQKQ